MAVVAADLLPLGLRVSQQCVHSGLVRSTGKHGSVVMPFEPLSSELPGVLPKEPMTGCLEVSP